MRRGPDRRDKLELVESIVDGIVANPSISATDLQVLVGARRADVFRVLRALRRLNPDLTPGAGFPGRSKRFRISENEVGS